MPMMTTSCLQQWRIDMSTRKNNYDIKHEIWVERGVILACAVVLACIIGGAIVFVWRMGPPPEVPVLQVATVYVEKEILPPALKNRLIRLAAFQNPEFYKAQAMRFPTFNKPRIVGCCEDFTKHIGIPRGCLEEVVDLLESLGINASLSDQRFRGMPLELQFHGTPCP